MSGTHTTGMPLGTLARTRNQKMFMADGTVRHYANACELQVAEQAIRERLVSWLDGKAMLELGIGGGRLTSAYTSLVGTYVGLDYSEPMVDACKARFGQEPPKRTFIVGDARNMPEFSPSSFDFVLFGFNGIDYVDHADRHLVFGEIRRVLKPGGFFCFSTHNLRCIPELFHLKLGRYLTVGAKFRHLVKYGVLHAVNPSVRRLSSLPHAIVNDGLLGFRLKTYYITPSEQLRQLEDAGFTDIEIYNEEGAMIPNVEADDATDFALHFLARCSGGSP